MELNHGGDIYSAQNAGCVDFSANINPLGLPESVRKALVAAARDCLHYPDPLCRGLRAAIGNYEGVSAENIFCAGGAAEIIFRIAWTLRPHRALIPVPTFSEYCLAVESSGGAVYTCPLQEEANYAVGDEFIEKIDNSIDLVFFCNPNNPTGTVVRRNLIEKLVKKCAQTGTFLVVDECFMDFVSSGEKNCSAKPLLNSYNNILILKAFTKIFAMPGVRFGYCLTNNQQLLKKLARNGQPWSVSVFAEKAGAAASKELAFVEKSRRFIENERIFLRAGLSKLGLKVFDGKANFLLFHAPEIFDLQERLLDHGFLIRSCANFEGLDGSFYRIAVRTHEENYALLRALEASI